MQCPLNGFPNKFKNTIEDVKRMIVEQNISYWIQLSPETSYGYTPPLPVEGRSSRDCRVFPLHYFENINISSLLISLREKMISDSNNAIIERYINEPLLFGDGISDFKLSLVMNNQSQTNASSADHQIGYFMSYMPYINMSYKITAYQRERVGGSVETVFTNPIKYPNKVCIYVI
jgi:hypothetical protein